MKKAVLCSVILFTTLIMFAQNQQRQVWLGGLQRTHLAQDANVLRVYFDKWGNLYPDVAVLVPYVSFFDPYNKINTFKHSYDIGNFEMYYKAHPDKLKTLAAHYQLRQPGLQTPKDTFYAIQRIISNRYVASLHQLIQNSKGKMLVVLIHGINDADPTGDYQQVRQKLNTLGYADSTTAYLEVFWDGLTANQGSPQFSGIWGMAQKNSAYVSLGVRDILRQLHDSTKIRIITHSLGGSVGTGALFNTTRKWNRKESSVSTFKRKKAPWDYIDSVKKVPAPMQADIRLGMFCPAIPGGSTFQDFDRRGATTVTAESNTIEKVVVGYNRNDYAVTKRFKGSDFLADKAGATTLGCNLEIKGKTEITRSIEALDALGFKGIIDSTDFTELKFGKREEHGLYYYLLNKKVDEFLGKVFRD